MTYSPLQTRGYLPHLAQADVLQFVTFGLGEDARKSRIQLNTGAAAATLRETLLLFHGKKYNLSAWVLMPDHIHVLLTVREPFSLPQVMHSLKSYTANVINRDHGRSGPLWRREHFDRYIRTEAQRVGTINYIVFNPVEAGLVVDPNDYPWWWVSEEARAGWEPAVQRTEFRLGVDWVPRAPDRT